MWMGLDMGTEKWRHDPRLGDKRRTSLVDKHRVKAARHAAGIAVSQGVDKADPDDADDDSYTEPAYAAERRKRLIEIANHASSDSRAQTQRVARA
jgi:hypothetical protein